MSVGRLKTSAQSWYKPDMMPRRFPFSPFALVFGLFALVSCSRAGEAPVEASKAPEGVAVDTVPEIPQAARTPALVPYEGKVEQLFFHPLIAFPELAFDGDREEEFISSWFVTVREFNLILEALHSGGYVLISPYDACEKTEENGVAAWKPKTPLVPEGKKPLILTMDDLNYYPVTVRNGTCRRMDVDPDGRLVTWTRLPSGREVVSDDNEIPTALERFVELHPDFSHGGARGVIALTGYYGFFGHASQDPDGKEYASELAMTQAVAAKLKSMGWLFANHSWGHRHQGAQSDALFFSEERDWKREAEKSIGLTDMYIFPFGEQVFKDKARFDFLKAEGYALFFTVMGRSDIANVGNVLRFDRVPVDGNELLAKKSTVASFFDRAAVIDPVRQRPEKAKAAKAGDAPVPADG